MQCGAQTDEASKTLTRRPATHNRPLIHAHGFNADASRFFRAFDGTLPGNFPAVARMLPGHFSGYTAGQTPAMPPAVRRTTRRMVAGSAASLPPEIRRRIGGHRILRMAKGFSFSCSIVIILRQFAIKSGASFCAMIALSPVPVRIKSVLE